MLLLFLLGISSIISSIMSKYNDLNQEKKDKHLVFNDRFLTRCFGQWWRTTIHDTNTAVVISTRSSSFVLPKSDMNYFHFLSLSFSTLNICDRPIITWNKAFCVCVFQRIYLIQPLFGAVVLQLFILRSSVEDEGWTHKCAPKCTHAHLCLQKNRRFHSLPQLPSFSYSCQNTIRQGIIYIIIPTYISHYASGALRAEWHTTCQDFIHAINKRH